MYTYRKYEGNICDSIYGYKYKWREITITTIIRAERYVFGKVVP